MSSSITLSFVALSFSLDWLTRELLGSASLHLPRLGLEACAARFRFYVDVGDSDSSLLAIIESVFIHRSSSPVPNKALSSVQIYYERFCGECAQKGLQRPKKNIHAFYKMDIINV